MLQKTKKALFLILVGLPIIASAYSTYDFLEHAKATAYSSYLGKYPVTISTYYAAVNTYPLNWGHVCNDKVTSALWRGVTRCKSKHNRNTCQSIHDHARKLYFRTCNN